MSSKPTSALQRAWFRWKALRLPWRKRFLVGHDLTGATFWEFADQLSANPTRMRRIVQYPRGSGTVHHSDVTALISPAWHQWLRHTRADAPSIAEQQQDVARRVQLKVLAAQADARWAAKGSFLDAPRTRSVDVAVGYKDDGMGRRAVEGGLGRGGVGGRAAAGFVDGSRRVEEVLGSDEMQTPDGKRHSFTRGERPPETVTAKEKEKDPWKKSRGGPSEEWQPKAWNPDALAARR